MLALHKRQALAGQVVAGTISTRARPLQLAGRDNIGVAFSGGGTRSASATLGPLRALHAMGGSTRSATSLPSRRSLDCCAVHLPCEISWWTRPFSALWSTRQRITLQVSRQPRHLELRACDRASLLSPRVFFAMAWAGDESAFSCRLAKVFWRRSASAHEASVHSE